MTEFHRGKHTPRVYCRAINLISNFVTIHGYFSVDGTWNSADPISMDGRNLIAYNTEMVINKWATPARILLWPYSVLEVLIRPGIVFSWNSTAIEEVLKYFRGLYKTVSVIIGQVFFYCPVEPHFNGNVPMLQTITKRGTVIIMINHRGGRVDISPSSMTYFPSLNHIWR